MSDIDLRRLADMSLQERAFLSVYLSDPRSLSGLERRLHQLRRALAAGGPERDELSYFDENVAALWKHLEKNPLKSGGLCLFVCSPLDVLEAIPLTASAGDHAVVDSSPFIRPLAELQDEYENVAVVVADNKRARIFLISTAVPGAAETIEGNVKNHVRKGGWSQQRYERRRDKQLLLYAREIVDALARLDREEEFRRILLVGGKEILGIVDDNLPRTLAARVAGRKAVHLGRGEEALHEDILELFFEEERQSEARLWEKIRTEFLREGLGVVGLQEVLDAARMGRVEKMLVDREFHPRGVRCRSCDRLHASEVHRCEECGSSSVYTVGVVNEICELLARTRAETDFVDSLPALEKAGRIGALLRY
jgi:peptide chain release factor subunit 1